MPLMEDAFGSRSGLNCAIGVLDGTVVGDAMVRDCVHIAQPGRVMRWDLTLQLLRRQLEWKVGGGVLE